MGDLDVDMKLSKCYCLKISWCSTKYTVLSCKLGKKDHFYRALTYRIKSYLIKINF